jgi:hypothetical protein
MLHLTLKRTRMMDQKAAHVGGTKSPRSGLSSPVFMALIFNSSRLAHSPERWAARHASPLALYPASRHPA